MGTKWKNWKKAISFLIFFLGVSLTLGSIAGFVRDKPYGRHFWQIGGMLRADYQESADFRGYIAGRLENFLVMAAEDRKERGGSSENAVYEGGYYGDYYYNDYYYDGYGSGMWDSAESYHDSIKGDKNLLYSISYDGKLRYANSDILTKDCIKEALEGNAPEGYNFFLVFDGEKVRIVKDGKELDVYGDGYYREIDDLRGSSGWYVPGYLNFPAGESARKAQICIAAAKEPVIYAEGMYADGASRQYSNSLYWMSYYFRGRQKTMLGYAAGFFAGIALLILAFFARKRNREALWDIAGLQAKIWIECKALLVVLLCAASVLLAKSSFLYGDLWQEIQTAYQYDETGMISVLGGEIVRSLSPLFWVLLFWIIFFIWNDVRCNKRIWTCGLIARLCGTFSAKQSTRPLSRRMARRNAVLFAAAVGYALLMSVLLLFEAHIGVWTAGIGAFVGMICFLGLAYATGRKNMETARDLEVLQMRVGEIRGGNYKDSVGQFSGHDLEPVMAELEDIQQGMERALDEQMKSERMKVELIANVSHDIKTPLTSIISYVQFLMQEEGLPEHVKDYIRILDEKSQRLKNMVTDVFAVSKAASGELPVHMETLDLGKLLCQTMADMQEQIENSAVSFRTELPENPVRIVADGQRMYRVFQNLFENAIKYSLDGSRVYVALKTEGERALASVKNTSHQELDRDQNFAERFARGDQSRTDGGSGLGLSIAQSFTEACGGTFFWETDADLFVVRISFPVQQDF